MIRLRGTLLENHNGPKSDGQSVVRYKHILPVLQTAEWRSLFRGVSETSI